MNAELEVMLTRTFDGRPLATVQNLPGGDADMTPAQMRALAAALCAAADECESRPMDKRRFMRAVRRYRIAGAEGARIHQPSDLSF